jgi:hypothetical protein
MMKASYRFLLIWSLTGALLSGALHVATYRGQIQAGGVLLSALLVGLCVLWPLWMFVMLADGGGQDRWKEVARQIPLWMRFAIYFVFAVDMGNGIWLVVHRSGASNASLSDFHDPLVMHSWSVHALLMYGMVAVVLFVALRCRRATQA